MLPEIISAVPGPKSRELAEKLADVECRNTTYLVEDWPIFWERAEGTNVWDVDGNRFLDVNSGFGVASLGHGFTGGALREQSYTLMHAMGDVHPARLKVELCEALSEMTFEKWGVGKGKCLLGNSGFEAIEAALKTCLLATGRSGILSFEGGYHGLGYGALLGQGIAWFRAPFDQQLANVVQRLPFPQDEEGMAELRTRLAQVDGSRIGAVLVEPIQGRGGILVPPRGFLKELRSWCDEQGVLLVFDEIYTGFWRTGECFACEREGCIPDLLCLGKALAGGFPISVCVGKASVMDRWPVTHGEALHTSTFLGNPMGCAMAIEALRCYKDPQVKEKVCTASEYFIDALGNLLGLSSVMSIRGCGLMLGIETDGGERAIRAVKGLLQDGIIALPDGPEGEIIAITPPFTISQEEMDFCVEKLRDWLGA